MKLDFTNKNVFVGGGTDGIGWECAKLFSSLGANVTLASRNIKKLESRKIELSTNNLQKHELVALDYTDSESLEINLRDFISQKSLKFDIIINNTGGPPGGQLHEANTQELLNAFNMHLISFHKILGLTVEGMKTRDSGRIINIISTSVKQPLNGLGVSNTIRGAVANWSKTLANELGAFNITVNNVLPGATNTGRLNEIISAKAKKLNSKESEISNQMAKEVPMNRIAEPQEVANAVVFLASDLASYINGINLPVDGGRTKSL
jgi:3-oxoacyl-[acyl-carrier protein] reductase